ncbi:hypothetical protein [Desulfofustis glycolicus]|uniref:Uncharacterized protein n=1 Tax=Desulfofustis glycolicus DSM 9705 TaxID=1121409 RepID=A0A1M5SLH4_9BACT|nr:hypothetical protein [Desulfofustis glycolicus]MCB2215655.1 hypothetical protein [Desulfobulbaceae bacterium]SHH39359.1 hypothetical protein SAMN02745124_00418 [Desulfofustis glycolicus DSM 9705]
MSKKAQVKGFHFKGFDESGEPIIFDGKNKKLTSQPGPPPGELVEAILIYHENPTWVCIGGKWYRIG